ncbi:uncharacterized protein LOC114548239 [Scomber scombrus]|uniref:Uncharacterized protein LOC114548239 n=1 Tax=Scomber scombrus TaxID=13677 RepID=A0AAV1PUM2_SCOSC
MDSIISQLHVRFSSMQQICDEFCVLWKFRDMPQDSISASCSKLSEKYKNDLTESLDDQIQHLKNIYSATFEDGLGPLDLLNAVYTMGQQSIYGDLCVLLHIFLSLSLPVTVTVAGERDVRREKECVMMVEASAIVSFRECECVLYRQWTS